MSPRTRVALKRTVTAGAEVVIVTARSPRSVCEIAREAGLGGSAICANGATVFDLEEARIVRHVPLDNGLGRELASGLRAEVPSVVFGWEHELRFGSEPAYEALRTSTWWPRPENSFSPCELDGWELPFTKLLARAEFDVLAEAFEVAVRLAAGRASVTLTGQAFVELMAKGVSKQAALERLAAERGVARRDVLAFGDHLADAGMLRWAGHGVAMENGEPETIAAADELAPSNDEDGVAVVLERLLSEGGRA